MTKFVKTIVLCVAVGVFICGLFVINFLRPDKTDDEQANKTTTTSSRESLQDEDNGDVDVIVSTHSSQGSDATKTGVTTKESTAADDKTAKGTTTTSTRGSDKDGTKVTTEATTTPTGGTDNNTTKDDTQVSTPPTRGEADEGWLPDVGTKAPIE